MSTPRHSRGRALTRTAATSALAAVTLVAAGVASAAADTTVTPPPAPAPQVDGSLAGDPAAAGRAPADDPAGKARSAALQSALNAIVAPSSPGSAVGTVAQVRGAQGSWSGAAGWADLGAGRRAEANDQFRAASNTKPMVAVLAMQEVEAGRWRLDTRVNDVLPGLLPRGYGRVTLRQLLSHTSGIPDFDDA